MSGSSLICPMVSHVRQVRCISGAVEPHRGADQCQSDPRPLGRPAPSCGVDHDSVRGAVYHPQETVRNSKTRPSREGAPRTRPYRKVALHDRMVLKSGTTADMPSRSQQGRGRPQAETRCVLPRAGRNPRPVVREPSIPRLWSQPRRQCDRPLEYSLSRPRNHTAEARGSKYS